MRTGEVAPRRWLVTGASRGIGLAIAKRIVTSGERLCILARGGSGHQAARHIGGGAVAVSADVADPEAIQGAVAEAAELLGGLDVVVNNAGQHRGGRVDSLSLEDWHSTLATNLSGPLHVIRAALPHFGASGAIVNIGAVVGYRGFPGDSIYGASKAGLAGLTQVLAAELAPRRIRVNLVIPGFVMSEMTEKVSVRARQRIIAKIPMGRMGEADEIADVVWWVAGSTYMSGSVIATDGGLMGSL